MKIILKNNYENFQNYSEDLPKKLHPLNGLLVINRSIQNVD